MVTQVSFTTVGSVGNVNSANSPEVLSAPAGLAAGHLLVVHEFFAQGIAGAQTAPAPAGMTKVSIDGTTPTRIGGIHYAIVDDPADFAGGIVLDSNSTMSRVAAVATAWAPTAGYHWDPASVVYAGPEYSATSDGSDTFPSVAARDLVLGSVMTNKGANATLSSATPAGGGTDLAEALATSGATNGPPNTNSVSDSLVVVVRGGTGVTYNINQANFRAESFGINEISEEPPPDPLPTVTGRGFGTVSRFLETRGATMAHRNLGLIYPEMTEYGTRMAANDGFGIIEVSCQRTSDGVWIGAHDQTVDRVTQENTYDGSNYSALTGAQVLALHVNVGSSGAPRPYATLQQIVETLPGDFIFMLDPKQAGGTTAYLTEFLDLVDALLGPERAILKFDGAATAARFQAAQARGYNTAAYYYAAPATPTPSGSVTANLPYVDIPGLNYNATQEGWDAFLDPSGAYYAQAGGLGKRMWGHVAETQANYNEAISKGASYVQSTSNAIAPVGVAAWRPALGPDGFAVAEMYAGASLAQRVHLGDTLIWERE